MNWRGPGISQADRLKHMFCHVGSEPMGCPTICGIVSLKCSAPTLIRPCAMDSQSQCFEFCKTGSLLQASSDLF